MSFAELGALLFPIYMTGCLLACLLNVTDRRMFALAFFYWFFVIAVFKLKYDGMAPVYGWRWYILVSVVQLLVIGCCYASQARAMHTIRNLGLAIIAVNLTYLPFYVTHHPLPRAGFFVLVNSFEAMQICALIAFSPLWDHAARAYKRASRTKRRRPWQHLTAHSGQT